MDVNFDAETPDGLVTFSGTLTQDEVSFLLQYALLTLLARGALPVGAEAVEVSEPKSIH